MTFKELLALVSSKNPPQIRTDSRLVGDGDIFVAVKGTVYDGHDFIDQAIASGAKYIVCQQNGRQKTEDRRHEKCKIIFVEDSAEAAALLAQARAGNPASQLINLAVTGTNGKTTVTYLVRSCIQKAGEKCGLIGTVIYDTCSGGGGPAEQPEVLTQSNMTTPDCLAIAEMTDKMVGNGAKYMVIEASSHALSQNRLAGVSFKAAAFTNLAGDHLDYHKTKEDYLAAKAGLFQTLSPDAVAVLNRQSPQAKLIAEQTRAKILWYAIDEPADISAHIESMDINGTIFALQYVPKSSIVNRQSSIVKTPLLGRYNVSNHLAAAGLCLAAGFDLEAITTGLSSLQGIPGRLEKISCTSHESPATSHVLVDYAHTDDALKNVLSTLKPLCKGKLRVVFGCGGDRDRTKRPRMARVVEQLADFIIVTNDNPRTEKPQDIIDEIISGFKNRESCIVNRESNHKPRTTSHNIIIEPDRKKAIELAIESAGKDDIVLIAGKGHETYQIIGKQKFDFSDKTVAQECLRKQIRKK
jgi:UDP-N-acetylmuramoyl-L-alanyl-D-glutamate--2,6-diaminopimelate ligase